MDLAHTDRAWFPTAFEYLEQMVGTCEAPDAFHYATFLTCAGALIGRKLWVEYTRPLYPNFLLCLMGESGLGRKSTSLEFGLEFVEDSVPTLRGLSSLEGLLQYYASLPEGEHRLLVAQTELSALLLKSKNQRGVANLIPAIAQLYDAPRKAELPTRKEPLEIHEPFLSMISAATPEWLEYSLAAEDVMGGFANRFMFVFGTPKRPVSLPQRPPSRFVWAGKLSKRLARTKPRRLVLSPEAEALWQEYYQRHYNTAKEEQDSLRRVLMVRFPEFGLKAATVIHALEDGGPQISAESMVRAVAWLEYLYEGLAQLRPILSGLDIKVLAKVVECGKVSRSELHRRLSGRMTASMLNQVLSNLHKVDQIRSDGKSIVATASGRRLIQGSRGPRPGT
jgi:hypothetical protein